jgi:hypothetical protein
MMTDEILGLIANLKHYVPHLYRMYEALEAREESPSLLELEIVQGKRRLDDPDVINYLSALPSHQLGDSLPVRS